MIDSLLHGMGQLLAYFYSLVPNYGVSIIMLTILVRTAMIPLAIKQAHSMQANRGNAEKMRKLQPEVKKLKEKYKDDRQRQYEEQKKLYEEHGVNMLGGLNGCLPMLLQMPIFLAMYAVLSGCSKLFMGRNCTPGYHIPKESPLYTAIVERSGTFLGTNLEFKPAEVFSNLGPVAVLPYAILIAVMGGTMYYQTNMMMKAQPAPDPQMAATQKIMKFMPLMLVFFSWQFPAGLILYWSATNVWTIGQQYVLMKKYGGTPVVPDGKPAKSPSGNAATAAVGDSGTKGSSPTKNAKSAVKAKPAGAPGRSGTAKGGAGGSARPSSGKTVPPGRRPAAKQARPGGKSSSSTSAKAGSNGQKAKGSATPSDGNGSGKAPGAKGPAARPKGSGARKGNKGGRR
jgi:YidC/Oxa1 family membrane protein insertase